MGREKIIVCTGASDEDVAHLRLLLRTAGAQLAAPWRWGAEGHADLVIVDAANLVGSAARGRALQRGVPCAELIAADALQPDGLFLRKPLRREDFVALLNDSERPVGSSFTLLAQGDDFFDIDLGETEDDTELPSPNATPWRVLPAPDELDAFEALFKRDDLADKPQILMPDRLDAGAGVEYTGEQTTRSARSVISRDPFATADGATNQNIDPSVRSFANVQDEGEYPLRDYLAGTLLGGPSRIALPGLPALILDPKEQVFHAEGGLSALEEYCKRPLRRADWRPALSAELREARERIPARPYLRLLWLERMITSNGYLSQHLDPGGSYKLTRLLELAQDYPRAFRIGAAMMGQPLRLHEIVAASQTSMAEVFSVVSAYDAIGWVEWQLRESFRSPPKPAR